MVEVDYSDALSFPQCPNVLHCCSHSWAVYPSAFHECSVPNDWNAPFLEIHSLKTQNINHKSTFKRIFNQLKEAPKIQLAENQQKQIIDFLCWMCGSEQCNYVFRIVNVHFDVPTLGFNSCGFPESPK